MGFFNQYIGAGTSSGGSGGSSNSTITDFRFNNTDCNLTITSSDGTSKVANLSELKTEWQKLKDVTVSSYFANLVNSAFGGKIMPGILDASGQSRPNNPDWVNIRFKVEPGHTYRLTHANSSSAVLTHNPARCVFFDSNDSYVSEMNWNNINAGTTWGDRKYAEITIPNSISNTIVYGSCNLRITGGYNERQQLMIWDVSESANPTEYVEFKKGGVLIGASVDKEFISTTGLTSKTVDGALDELNRKSSNGITNIGLSANGNSYEFKTSDNRVVGELELTTIQEIDNIINSLN